MTIEPKDGKTYWVRINGGKPFLADYRTENKDRDGRATGPAWWQYQSIYEVPTADAGVVLTVIRELLAPVAEQDKVFDHIVEAVRADLLARSIIGIAKYGVTLDRTDLSLRDWLQHAYEKTLDQANYLKRAIIEMEKNDVCG